MGGGTTTGNPLGGPTEARGARVTTEVFSETEITDRDLKKEVENLRDRFITAYRFGRLDEMDAVGLDMTKDGTRIFYSGVADGWYLSISTRLDGKGPNYFFGADVKEGTVAKVEQLEQEDIMGLDATPLISKYFDTHLPHLPSALSNPEPEKYTDFYP